jgi:hypothetical protein
MNTGYNSPEIDYSYEISRLGTSLLLPNIAVDFVSLTNPLVGTLLVQNQRGESALVKLVAIVKVRKPRLEDSPDMVYGLVQEQR